MTGNVYSLVVEAPEPLLLREQGLLFDRGRNVFSVILNDPEEFTQSLVDRGMTVVAIHALGETVGDPLPILV